MKELFMKTLNIAKMEIMAPVGGGGIGIFTWAVQLAPIISIIAAILGVVLGVMSYRLKRKQVKMEMDFYAAKIKQYSKKNN